MLKMRFASIILRAFCTGILLFAATTQAQQVQWSHVSINTQNLNPKLDPARLGAAQKAAIGAALQRDERSTFEDDLELCLCNANQWRHRLRFFSAPLGRPRIVLVSPPLVPGASSVNESHWLVELQGSTVHILASSFGGWGLGIQPYTSHGLNDFVIGWHMSAADTSLSYFRYNGRKYHHIAGEELTPCASGRGNVCFSDGSHTLDNF